LAAINPAVGTSPYLVLINPSAGSLLPIRGWPLDHFKTLAARIVERYDALIVLIGLKEAHDSAAQLCDAIGSAHCVNFTGQTSFKDLLDLMHLAQVLVTVDSGPAHFASLTDIHNIVLFGPETPDLYSPLGPNVTVCSARFSCSPCLSAYNHRETPCRDAQCMSAITVDDVFEAVCSALEKAGQEG
jgi:ADP-heptose:LPS heptosyltransferase